MTASFHSALHRGAVDELAEIADSLDETGRIDAIRTLSRPEMARLWEMAENPAGRAELSLLLPDSTPPGHTVEWIGKNSLPAFNAFSKRFTRSPEAGTLTGRNVFSLERLVGPGYFTAVRRLEKPAEILFDYTRYPAAAPPGWPALARNDRGLSRFVFKDMHDYFRPIGQHLGIGAAFDTEGRFRGQYFVLTRGPLLPIGL